MAELSLDGGETFTAFDLDTVMADEAIAVEEAFGFTWTEFFERLQAGSIKAQRALIWLMQRRENPELKPGEVNYELVKLQIRGVEDITPLEGAAESNGSGI